MLLNVCVYQFIKPGNRGRNWCRKVVICISKSIVERKPMNSVLDTSRSEENIAELRRRRKHQPESSCDTDGSRTAIPVQAIIITLHATTCRSTRYITQGSHYLRSFIIVVRPAFFIFLLLSYFQILSSGLGWTSHSSCRTLCTYQKLMNIIRIVDHVNLWHSTSLGFFFPLWCVYQV